MTKNSLNEGLHVIIEGILSSKDKNNKFRMSKYNCYKHKKEIKLVKIFLTASAKIQLNRILSRNRKLSSKDVTNWTKSAFDSMTKDEHVVYTDNKTVKQVANEIFTIIKKN